MQDINYNFDEEENQDMFSGETFAAYWNGIFSMVCIICAVLSVYIQAMVFIMFVDAVIALIFNVKLMLKQKVKDEYVG